jgi:micrococcal nuclease
MKIFAYCLLVILFLLNNISYSKENTPPEKIGIFKVLRVIDGDTIAVSDKKNKEIKVRLIGIDCPESNQPYGKEATLFTKQQITKYNNIVTLYRDGNLYDKYGRLLALVYLGRNASKQSKMLNVILLREGLAKAQTQYRFSKQNKILFTITENNAKEKELRMWESVSH